MSKGGPKGEPNPFDAFRETTPLNDLPTDSVDEFLSRINDDLVAGAVERITDDRLGKLVSLYRAQAIDWEIKQKEKPARKTPGERKKSIADALNITIEL